MRPFVCRDAVRPSFCVATGGGILQASVLVGHGRRSGRSWGGPRAPHVTGEPALGPPGHPFAPPSGAKSSPDWPSRALWGPGSVAGSWFVSPPFSRVCLWDTSSGPRADQDSHRPSSPASGVHVAFPPFPGCFRSYFSHTDWPASPGPSRGGARTRCSRPAGPAEKPGTSQRGMAQRKLPERVSSQAVPSRPTSSRSRGWGGVAGAGSTWSAWPA